MRRKKIINSALALASLLMAGPIWGNPDVVEAQETINSEMNNVTVQDGLISVNVECVGAEALLKKIVEEAGITLNLVGEFAGCVSLSFRGKPFKEVLRRVLGETSVAIWRDKEGEFNIYALRSYQGEDAQEAMMESTRNESTPASESTVMVAEPHPIALPTSSESLAAIRGRIDHINSDSDMVNLITYDPDPTVRRMAVIKLGQEPNGSSLSGLSAALSDEDRTVRLRAVMALGRMRNEESIKLLSQALFYDSSPIIRRMAAKKLAKMGPQQALTALQTAQGDPDDKVRKIAEVALARYEKY